MMKTLLSLACVFSLVLAVGCTKQDTQAPNGQTPETNTSGTTEPAGTDAAPAETETSPATTEPAPAAPSGEAAPAETTPAPAQGEGPAVPKIELDPNVGSEKPADKPADN